MKKFLFGSSFILISTLLAAQVLVGPVVGTQVSWAKFGNSDNNELYSVQPVYGFHVGGSIAFRVQKRFFLQSSILYTQKSKQIEGKLDQMLNNKSTYHYIEMPLLYTAEFKFSMGRDKVFKAYIGAGPNISYWLGGNGLLLNSDLNENLINPPSYSLPYTITFGKDLSSVQQGEMNIEDPNRWQLGLQLSSGVIFEPWKDQKIMITARYILGHSFLSATSDGDFGLPNVLYYEDELSVRIKEISLSLYYFMDLKTEDRKKGKTTSKIKTGKRKR